MYILMHWVHGLMALLQRLIGNASHVVFLLFVNLLQMQSHTTIYVFSYPTDSSDHDITIAEADA